MRISTFGERSSHRREDRCERGANDAALQRSGEPYVSSESLLGIVHALVSSKAGLVRIQLFGGEYVEIDAKSLRYHADVRDWDAFCSAHRSRYSVMRLSSDVRMSGPGRPVGELCWIIGYHASAGRLPRHANRHAVIRLLHWPNFTRLPCDPEAYRLCALLARRPSSIHLAGRLLGLDEGIAFRFFSAAHASGAVEVVTKLDGIDDLSMPKREQTSISTPDDSLKRVLKSLWKKMVGG